MVSEYLCFYFLNSLFTKRFHCMRWIRAQNHLPEFNCQFASYRNMNYVSRFNFCLLTSQWFFNSMGIVSV